MDPLKYYMTINYQKPLQCSIYPKDYLEKIDWHHILGRSTQELTNNRNNIIALGEEAHAKHDELETMMLIVKYQIETRPEWIHWYYKNRMSPKGVIYKPNIDYWMQVLGEMGEALYEAACNKILYGTIEHI